MKKANQQRAAEMQFQSQQAIFKILCQGCPYKAMPGRARQNMRNRRHAY